MRVTLALAVAFCLAFPLAAEAAGRYRVPIWICSPRLPPLAREVCLCELSGGDPHIFYFPPPPRVICLARGLHP